MDYKTLTTLKTILNEGSFQKAAKRLNYNQSTVTFQIQQLEQELSVKLFEKIGRSMALTKAGAEIMPYVEETLQSMEKILNYGKSLNQLTGELKVAMAESLISYQMSDILTEFKKQAPGVRLSLQSVNCYRIEESLLEGSLDLGICYNVNTTHPALIQDAICTYPLALAASPGFSPEDSDFLKKDQDKSHISMIFAEPNSISREIFEQYLKENHILTGGTIELWSIESIKRSVASGLGATYLPRFTMVREFELGELTELANPLPDRKITAQCVYHKNKWISPAMELFLRLVKDLLR